MSLYVTTEELTRSVQWDGEKRKLVLDYWEAGHSEVRIAALLQEQHGLEVNRNQVHSIIRRHKNLHVVTQATTLARTGTEPSTVAAPAPTTVVAPPGMRREQSDVELLERLQRNLAHPPVVTNLVVPLAVTPVPQRGQRGRAKVHAVYEAMNTYMQENQRGLRVLSLSDLHAPYTDTNTLNYIVAHYKQYTDVLVINGDLLDETVVSTFKSKDSLDIMTELEHARTLLTFFAQHFPTIIWLSGNHERRWEKYGKHNVPKELLGWFLDNDPMLMFEKEFPDQLFVVDNWYLQLGTAVFAHPDQYSGGKLGKTAEKMLSIFLYNRDLQLPNPQVQALVMGHTHMLVKTVDRNVLRIEQGCLQRHDMIYHLDNPSERGWQTGFALIYLTPDGAVDLERSDAVALNPSSYTSC